MKTVAPSWFSSVPNCCTFHGATRATYRGGFLVMNLTCCLIEINLNQHLWSYTIDIMLGTSEYHIFSQTHISNFRGHHETNSLWIQGSLKRRLNGSGIIWGEDFGRWYPACDVRLVGVPNFGQRRGELPRGKPPGRLVNLRCGLFGLVSIGGELLIQLTNIGR